MFKRLIAVAAVVAGAMAVAAPAMASPVPPVAPVQASQVTELSPVVYGPNWVLNNYKDFNVSNNLVSVFNDLGEGRTWFHVTQLVNVSEDQFPGDEVITIQNDRGQYLTQWNRQNPAVNDWRARWNWVRTGDVPNTPSAQWVVVPNADKSSYALVEVSSLGNTDGPYALTVAQGGSTRETNGVPAWSDMVLLPLKTDSSNDNAPNDPAQLFTFKNLKSFIPVS